MNCHWNFPSQIFTSKVFILPTLLIIFTLTILYWTRDKPLLPDVQTVKPEDISFECSGANQTCSRKYPQSWEFKEKNRSTCPDYFRWIHGDLRPWKKSGITRALLDHAENLAHFRLVVKGGKVFVKRFKRAYQTRDEFTIWGIYQLLRRYPGSVPDLELIFSCEDLPAVNDHGAPKTPLFGYCSDGKSLDIAFPDWSFWGWPEIDIGPWNELRKEFMKENNKTKWMDREPYAFWKGNPHVSFSREDLMTCNVTSDKDWNARIYLQDWDLAWRQGYKNSHLENQCKYRYKIYIEGRSWSVSEKYILACDSPALFVKMRYYDFFTRGLKPLKHYWPLRDTDKCRSIKFAVEWGNNHTKEAEAMGREGSKFVEEQLRMEDVYDYMYHLLNEYAKLQRFTPKIPEGATEICAENIICKTDGFHKKFLEESQVKWPSLSSPCIMLTPYNQSSIRLINDHNLNTIKKVKQWEDTYYKSHD